MHHTLNGNISQLYLKLLIKINYWNFPSGFFQVYYLLEHAHLSEESQRERNLELLISYLGTALRGLHTNLVLDAYKLPLVIAMTPTRALPTYVLLFNKPYTYFRSYGPIAVHISPILFLLPQFYVLFHIVKMHKFYGFKYKPAVQVQ